MLVRILLLGMLAGLSAVGEAASACPPERRTPVERTGIRGEARIGPIFPVDRPGVRNSRPYADAVVAIHSAATRAEVARVRTDRKGRFEVKLPPGTYVLVPVPPDPRRPYPFAGRQTVTVEAGRMTKAVIEFDTGIR